MIIGSVSKKGVDNMITMSILVNSPKILSVLNERKNRRAMISQLVSVERKQEELFDIFEREVAAIQEGPFHAGLVYLEEAAMIHKSKKQEKELLEKALHTFIEAYGIQRAKKKPSPLDVYFAGYIQSYIGITYLLTKSPIDAHNWLTKSTETLSTSQQLFKADIKEINSALNALLKSQEDETMLIKIAVFMGILNENVELDEIPKYKERVARYSKAQVESESYLTAMEQLRVQVKEELESKGQLQQLGDKVSGLFVTTKKKSAEVLAIGAPAKKAKDFFSGGKNKNQ